MTDWLSWWWNTPWATLGLGYALGAIITGYATRYDKARLRSAAFLAGRRSVKNHTKEHTDG